MLADLALYQAREEDLQRLGGFYDQRLWMVAGAYESATKNHRHSLQYIT